MKKTTLSLLLCCIAYLGVSQTIKPYLQAAKPNSIHINWKTDNGTNPRVEYGLTQNDLSTIIYGVTENLEPKDSDYSTPYHYHTVKLTDLFENTGYYYKVYSGDTDESEIEYFKTPPSLGDNSGTLRFIALGDHQIINYQGAPYMKFNELVQAAKSKAEELYGTPIADNFNLILNDGDQVDLGKLEHYEKIHFQKSSYLTPNLPIITAVGNHETYGSSYQNGGIQSYFDHFILDDEWTYGGINSGTERYYAYQLANVLFLVLDTEATTTTQKAWAESVIDYAIADSNVEWIISIGHRPYQAEQYSNDYSSWFGNDILPKLKTTDKFVLHIGGHHHLYARGQFEDHNAYHMISGGTAWPQYWGDSNNEDDREETQGSWSNFAYQLIEINNDTDEINVQSYTIGSLNTTKNNVLLDEMHYKRNINVPNQPNIINEFIEPVNLPITLNSSSYDSSTTEALNSTQFQISSTENFSILELDTFRHVDNFFGPEGSQTDETMNIGEGMEILNYNIPENFLNNGIYHARVRHRDENLGWSAWSEPISFEVVGSLDGEPGLSINQASYNLNEPIEVTFLNGPGGNLDWIGIYQNEIVPGESGSAAYQYTSGAANGIKTFNLDTSGIFYAGFFINDGYQEIADRVYFWVGAEPILSSNEIIYDQGDDVIISFTDHPNNESDWIGIYKAGIPIGENNEIMRLDVDTNLSQLTFSNLPSAYYYAIYHIQDTYLTAGESINFQVGTEIAVISTEKTTFSQGEPITIDFVDGPAIEKDYIGTIIDDGQTAGTDNLWSYKYFGGLANGTTTITGTDFLQGGPNQLPVVGSYYLAMYTNDSYTQVSNAIAITITDDPAIYMDEVIVNQNEPFTVNFVNAPGNNTDWIGLYLEGQTPTNVTSQSYEYIDGEINGSRSFTLSSEGEHFAGFFENDGYTELSERIAFTVRQTPILSTTETIFESDEDVIVNLEAGGLANVSDWIGIYLQDDEPNQSHLIQRIDVLATPEIYNFGMFSDGLYYATYHTEDTFQEVGERVNFQVGNQVATLTTSVNNFYINQPIAFTFANSTGDNEDFIAVFSEGSNPTVDPLSTFLNLNLQTDGTITLDGLTGAEGEENILPQTTGNYFAVIIDPTTGDEISNRTSFTINVGPTVSMDSDVIETGTNFLVNYANGPGNTTDWLGTYLVGQTPGGPTSTSWEYVDPDNLSSGVRTLDAINQPGDYFLAFFENDGYNEISERFYFEVVPTLSADDVILKDGDLKIYPNPTTGIAYVQLKGQTIENVQVFDQNGKDLDVKFQINNDNATLNLRSFSNGVYFVKVSFNGTSKTLKLALK
ncbi:metallophosphoesterase [Sediminibacter sp. Hel_I_10]|uniref:metallophosphoesterase n=1 Tax=Sediminibacter sp. Hel_I_10 TaxID=1392490 RepID=UPI00068AC360|nr:metallophosphoesterase [Sediminibacter sp. Hel_I_10]